MEDLLKTSANKLMDMSAMEFSHKTIKVFQISDPTEQEAFEAAYNDKDAIVTILRDYFDQGGNFYLAVEIRKVSVQPESEDDGSEA